VVAATRPVRGVAPCRSITAARMLNGVRSGERVAADGCSATGGAQEQREQ
jgi:hypothetical protein